MRILLFICSIYDTLNKMNYENFIDIIDEIQKIKEIEQDDKIIVSFCDDTKNRNILMPYIINIIDKIDEGKIILGNQYLGDVYYKNFICGGALLYNEEFSKEKQVAKYVKDLENNDNFINLYYIDSNMDTNLINELLKDCKNVNLNLIKESNLDIIKKLNEKKKKIYLL